MFGSFVMRREHQSICIHEGRSTRTKRGCGNHETGRAATVSGPVPFEGPKKKGVRRDDQGNGLVGSFEVYTTVIIDETNVIDPSWNTDKGVNLPYESLSCLN